MNFFQYQETAKRNTLWLLVMFAMGVASIILVIDMLVLVGVGVAESEGKPRDWNQVVLHNLPLLAGVSAFVGLLVGGASLFRLAELGSGGGASVAEMLGGRVIPPETIDPTEKKDPEYSRGDGHRIRCSGAQGLPVGRGGDQCVCRWLEPQ